MQCERPRSLEYTIYNSVRWNIQYTTVLAGIYSLNAVQFTDDHKYKKFAL
jgi:hypothetical protein